MLKLEPIERSILHVLDQSDHFMSMKEIAGKIPYTEQGHPHVWMRPYVFRLVEMDLVVNDGRGRYAIVSTRHTVWTFRSHAA